MEDIFIIDGHGQVRNSNNIKASLINQMRKSGDIVFYNLSKPAESIGVDLSNNQIIKMINDSNLSLGYLEGAFKKDHGEYLTTSIQDKYLGEVPLNQWETWSIKPIIDDHFLEIYSKNHIRFYQHRDKKNLYYIRVARGHEKVATLSEILKSIFISKKFLGKNRRFVWAACRPN
ncbi:MAG: hypothetical protein ACRBFS_17115 [Aureispira sp.]